MEPSPGQCYIVSGLQYGDEGKGAMVDYLVKQKSASLVIRYGGGPQAAHHVVKPDGTWHCFSHYGSGMFWDKCGSVLSKYMLIYPQTLDRQTQALSKKTKNPIKRLKIDYECYVITPYHQMMSRILQILRSRKKGSTGIGVGQAAQEVYRSHSGHFPRTQLYKEQKFTTLQVKDLLDSELTKSKLQKILQQKKQLASRLLKCPVEQLVKILYPNIQIDPKQVPQLSYETKKLVVAEQLKFVSPDSQDNLPKTLAFYKEFAAKYKGCFCQTSTLIKESLGKKQTIIFEGSQGALLDVVYGFYPHTTKTICTTENVFAILKQVNVSPKVTKIGVLRCYSHRHGQGPFVPYDQHLTDKLPELHNRYSKWQGNFKIGYLDKVALQYGIEIFEPDLLAVTSLDRIVNLEECDTVCTEYKVKTSDLSEDELSILKKRFHCRVSKEEMVIYGVIKVQEKDAFKNDELARILNKCQPVLQNLKEIPLDGTLAKISNPLLGNTANLINYVRYISQKQIAILSLSPTHEGKIQLIEY